MNKRHYDSRGHEVHEWSVLKATIKHPEYSSLLKKSLLSSLVIHPYTTIRISLCDSTDAEITFYGTGPSVTRRIFLNTRQLQGLRNLYKKGGANGWKIDKSSVDIRFTFDAWVTLDSTRRYQWRV